MAGWNTVLSQSERRPLPAATESRLSLHESKNGAFFRGAKAGRVCRSGPRCTCGTNVRESARTGVRSWPLGAGPRCIAAAFRRHQKLPLESLSGQSFQRSPMWHPAA
jgi:hypothetical protein